MKREQLTACNELSVRQIKSRLRKWYDREGDYVYVPHEERRGAAEALLGQLQLDVDAGSTWTPPTWSNGDAGRILAIAHIDTVLSLHWTKDAGDVIYSPALDDRIGLYTFFCEFDGIVCDILLTDHEEVGRSTAQFFKAPRGRVYNWMVQFDRRGTDVVMYQYDTDANRRRLMSIGARPELGSYSDIAYLDNLGVAGFNWGTGYWGEHTEGCHVVVADYEAMLERFRLFYARYGGEKIEHAGRVTVEASDWGAYGYWDEVECELCGRPVLEEKMSWDSELQCWVCDDCTCEVDDLVVYGNCVGCGQWRELKMVQTLGERLCPKCRSWWHGN